MSRNEKENDGSTYVEQMKVADDKEELKGYGVRHQQCLILFFCLATAYTMRSCMGVALVAMTISDHSEKSISEINNTRNNTLDVFDEINQISNNTEEIHGIANKNDMFNHLSKNISNNHDKYIENNNDDKEFKSSGFFNSLLLIPPYPKMKWSKKNQDLILSSFQWGYMILQIPASQLAHRFGARSLLTGALTINCVVSFVTPWAAFYGGWICTILCRIVQGLSQACVMPGLYTLFGKWAPLEERARLAGFVLGGQALGTVLGLPITGFLAASPLGWPGIFRFYGLLSGLVGLVLWFVVADAPAQHSSISATERRYIEEGLGQKGDGKKHLPVPWSHILRSRGMYAIVIAHIGQTWGQLTLYSEVPAFMANVMGVNIKANGLLTALPFLVMWFTNFFFSWFTDMIIVKKILSVTNARKVANSLGCVPASLGLVALSFAPKNIYLVETILVIICGFKISAHVGFQLNHIDISPNFAGTMMSLSNFVSNLVGSLATIVAGLILTDPTDERLWRYVFLVSASLYFLTNLVYVLMGTCELAAWNDPPERTCGDPERERETRPMIRARDGT